MRLVDTHAHLDFPDFDQDRDQLIEKLNAQQIAVINIATDLQSIDKVDSLSRENELIWGAIGLHPCEIGPKQLLQLDETIIKMESLFDSNPKLVALGEVGLDYFHSTEHIGDQKVILGELLHFARGRDLPVIFHCRNAYGDLLTILKRYPGTKGVVHCYSSNLEQAKEYLDLGLYISFTGMLTYPKNAELRDVAKEVPLDRLLLETDSPFLAPQSNRGQRNDPRAVEEIAQTHSDIRSIPVEEVIETTTANAVHLFGLNK